MTVIPDVFYGDAIEMNAFAGVDLSKWKQGGYSSKGIEHSPETIDPIIKASLQRMRKNFSLKVCGRGSRPIHQYIPSEMSRTD